MQKRHAIPVLFLLCLSFLLLLGLIGFITWLSAQSWVAKERISFGEKTFISEEPSLTKKAGIEAIKAKKWKDAINKFKESLKENPNDPEARIFLNNAQIGSKESYSIAVSVPIRNNNDGSLEILRGVAQAQDEINYIGGINEIPLKVAIASDDNEPKVAQQVATALVNNPNVLGVVGHYASDVTIAAKDIYTSKKLVAITPISTSVDLTKNSDSSKNCEPSKNSESYIFRTVPSDCVTAKALTDHIFQKMKKNNNVAIFYNSNSNYSKSLKSEFKKAISSRNKVVKEPLEIDLNQQNFNPASSVRQAIKQGTEVLMLAADTSTLLKALEVVRFAKGENVNILAGDAFYTSNSFRDPAVGMVVAAFWHIDSDPNSTFVENSKKLWGNVKVNWRTALAYDATQALIAAIEMNQTRSGIQQALLSAKLKVTGASGNIGFLPSGDRKDAKVQLVQIICDNDSGTSCKFEPVKP